MNIVMERIVLGSAAASALTGGVLFAFSSFVMPALRTLPTATAVTAMQAINLAAPRSLLMVPLLGSAAGCAVVGVYAVVAGPQPGRGWLAVGALAGVLSMALTAAYHVPHNTALAVVDPLGPSASAAWHGYASGWTGWNHVRAAAALVSAAALVIATRAQP
jgi:uncharacterized membrane protein